MASVQPCLDKPGMAPASGLTGGFRFGRLGDSAPSGRAGAFRSGFADSGAGKGEYRWPT